MRNNSKFLLILTVLLLGVFVAPVAAQTPSQEASPSPDVEEQEILNKAQEIRKKAQEKILAQKMAAKKKAFWGKLKEITNSTLVIESAQGERRVKTDEETDIFLGKQKIGVKDLEISSFLIAMGYAQEDNLLEGKRILALKKAPEPATRRHAVYGKVTDISEDEKVLALTHPKKEITYEIKVTENTRIRKKVEGKMKKVGFSEIEIGDRIAAIGVKSGENNTIAAKVVQVIPGKAQGLEEKSPTPTKE